MPKRITPDEVKEMFRLYEKYGNCAEDARHMNRSASAVSRYIRMGKDSPQVLKMVTRQSIGNKGTPKIAAQSLRNNVRR